jgi:hypothetical protein
MLSVPVKYMLRPFARAMPSSRRRGFPNAALNVAGNSTAAAAAVLGDKSYHSLRLKQGKRSFSGTGPGDAAPKPAVPTFTCAAGAPRRAAMPQRPGRRGAWIRRRGLVL